MSVSETILAYLRVLVWPVLILVIAFAFRSTIRSLLRVRLSQIDAAGFSAKFEQVTLEAERLVKADHPAHGSKKARPDDYVHVKALLYTDARKIGEAFRAGKPVMVDLRDMTDADARRMVDFSAGAIFTGRGSLYRVADKQFALLPVAYDPDF